MSSKLSQEEVVRRIKALHPTLEVTGTYVNVMTPIEVRCTLCGRTWKTLPRNLFRGSGCTCQAQRKTPRSAAEAVIACRKKASERFPDIIVPNDLKTTRDKFEARCTSCGHVWTTTLKNLVTTHGCPKCSRQPTSTAEMFLFEAVRLALYPERVLFRDSKTIGHELDIYVPGRAKAIEFGAWRWHKNRIDDDIAKERLCEEAGIELLTIYARTENGDVTLPKNAICTKGKMQSLRALSAMATRALAFIAADGKERSQRLDWQRILDTARKRTDRKAIVQRFADRMAKEHPDIEVLGCYVRADKPIEVRCAVCGHTWAPTPTNLLQGRGCPVCGRKRAAMKNRERGAAAFKRKMAEVNPTITIVGTYTTGHEKLECSCNVCGHHWMAQPTNLLQGRGCPECAKGKRQASKNAEAKASFLRRMSEVNPTITIVGTYTKAREKLECSCNVCGHRWMTRPADLLRGHGCPECSRKKSIAAMAAARAAKRTAKAAQSPNDSPQSKRGDTLNGSYREEDPYP